MERYVGRPEKQDGRLEKEIRVYDLLDRLNIEFFRVDHEPAMTMEVCGELNKALGCEICKNLFLCNRQKTKFYLLLIHGDKKFATKDISAQINSPRLSFASGEDMERYLDITPGSVSVMGLMNDKDNAVQLLIDEDVIKAEYIGCHPCINTSTLKFKSEDLLSKILPEIHHEPIIVNL